MQNETRNDAEFESIWTLWRTGKIDLTAALRSEQLPKIEEHPAQRYQPQADPTVYLRYVRHSRKFYNICATVLCVVFAVIMLLTVANLPRYGSADTPTNNEVAQRYVEKGTEETGAVNTVAGMILDYRAFDTLGESFVLFTAVCAVTILMKQSGRRTRLKPSRELVHYVDDPIVRSVCKFLFPVIMVIGVYILLNGHLSPGGGFSGGAVLGAGLIIYAMVWGEEQASRIFSEKLIKIITLCSLGFYCLAKSYSFFTGANHLHSIISPGTPGRIFSAGLILPLNVAVGFVVCCTMYSFYMYFRRGKL
jgi:multisubunit Na+/H+ antiporter MnhB subunit